MWRPGGLIMPSKRVIHVNQLFEVKALYFPFITCINILWWMMISGSVLGRKNKHKWVRQLSTPQSAHRLVRKSACRTINVNSIDICRNTVESGWREWLIYWVGKERLSNILAFELNSWRMRKPPQVQSDREQLKRNSMQVWCCERHSFCRLTRVHLSMAGAQRGHYWVDFCPLPAQWRGCRNWELTVLPQSFFPLPLIDKQSKISHLKLFTK